MALAQSTDLIARIASEDSPTITVSTGSSSMTAADPRFEKAQELFASGKALFQQGKKDQARREFDQAIDLLLAATESAPDRARLEKKLEDLIDRIYRFDLEMGAGELEQTVFEKSPLDEIREITLPLDPKLKAKVTEELKLSQSQLPLVLNDAVLSFINYFTSERGRRTLVYGFKRAGRYKPMISKILAEEGVPQELIYLAQAESGFSPRAVSYMAAAGMWQFITFRGQEYGLKQSQFHDDRLDPEKATRAAARHLKDLFTQLGDWHLALAAYNCGPMCVDSAVRRTGYADYWQLRSRNALPRETANYVPIILAMTIIAKNPKIYGLDKLEVDEPLETEAVPLDANTGLQLIADVTDTPLATLKEMNPAYIHNVIPRGLDVKVPVGTAKDVSTLIAKVPADKRTLWRMHRMQAGETLDSVSRTFRSSQSLISQANDGLSPDDATPGQMLVVPTAPEVPRAVPARYYWARGKRATPPAYVARFAPAKGKVAAAKAPVAAKRPAAPAPRMVAMTARRR
ncbi:MAG: transglycosylase SLT domain-containing protein [Bryobacteraceae bacterium]|nr:transglycosylase SLT domain-containing protein [Bryobacteraceae bacterium]